MNKEQIYCKLTKVLPTDRIIQDADMGQRVSFKAGGSADILVSPADESELAFVLHVIEEAGCDGFFMGNGSNFFVRDGGYRGIIIHMGEAFSQVIPDPEEKGILTAGCGAFLSQVARSAAELSLAGLEFASGIPGSLGGAVFMNAGAYGGEMKDVLLEVRAMDRRGRIQVLRGEELKLGYRHSIFHENEWVILEGRLSLVEGSETRIRQRMKELAQQRNEKQPVNYPSGGSFFKRPPGYFAGKLIQDAGLSGLSCGGAQVSELHAGFIINRGGATGTDIINLMKIVQNTVMDQFGVMLLPEVKIIGEE